MSSTSTTFRSSSLAFSGWRDGIDEDEEVERRDTQRFPTSYLRHRCSTPIKKTPDDEPNYVWNPPDEHEGEKSAMMDQDVDVKIEEVEYNLRDQVEPTFWQVSGPGFVWPHDTEVRVSWSKS